MITITILIVTLMIIVINNDDNNNSVSVIYKTTFTTIQFNSKDIQLLATLSASCYVKKKKKRS